MARRPFPFRASGLTAIPLHDIDLLSRHTATLRVPVFTAHGEAALDVRVPTLGAYAVNKANTFSRRRGPANARETHKGAKDLLYLHDLMAAGRPVVEQVERDIAAVATGAAADIGQLRGGASHLGLALQGGELGRLLTLAVAMLMERSGAGSEGQAMASLRGYLVDLHEILSDILREHDVDVLVPGDPGDGDG